MLPSRPTLSGLLALSLLGLVLPACGGGDEIVNPPPKDDTGVEEDDTGDGNVTVTDAGNDIASADVAEFYDCSGDYYTAECFDFSNALDPAGDRDFWFIQPTVGHMVLTYSIAYYLDGDMEPDTVLRVYDSAGTMVAENDDMPYRFWETDSALYWQATDPDGYYIEILEFSDWDADATASGGSSYTYDGFVWSASIPEPEPNDTNLEADDRYTDTTGDGPYTYYGSGFDEYLTEFYGEIGSAGDVDVWKLEATDAGYVYEMSFWPTNLQNLDATVTLSDSDGNVLAQTNAMSYVTDQVNPTEWYRFTDNVGLLAVVPTAGSYYLTVEDTNGAGGEGQGYFYPGHFYTYTGYNEDMVTFESDSNDSVGLGDSLKVNESSSDPGYFYAWWIAKLYTDGGADAADNFVLEADSVGGTLEGQYLSVLVDTARLGSTLDAKLTIYDSDTTTVLAESSFDTKVANADDPMVVDLLIPDDGSIRSRVYISITEENGDTVGAPGYSHFGSVRVYNEPLFSK